MNIWVVVGILAVIGLLYFGIFSLPTTGMFVDIPSHAENFLVHIGNPFAIVFWVAVFFAGLAIIKWMVRD